MHDFRRLYTQYRKKTDELLCSYLSEETDRSYYSEKKPKYPHTLYDPVNYIMSGGGKRIRPMMMILTCKALGGNADDTLNAAIAIEILHNFTLVHDDIMDNANTRRGKETVHKKWDVNTAILVGDELIGLSYRSLLKTKTKRIEEIIRTFTDGVIEVCEGQALDKEYEQNDEIDLHDYFVMIRKKTAELLRTSALIGALVADASKEHLEIISCYSEHIGMAFQVNDDLLDVIGNETEFGKKIGGDILENKKTFLFLSALNRADKNTAEKLKNLYKSSSDEKVKISKVIEYYQKLSAVTDAQNEIKKFTLKAEECLKKLEPEACGLLKNFSRMLLNRQY